MILRRFLEHPMSERKTQISDEPTSPGGSGGQPSNLWGLVVVPAGIVIAIVVIGALFGALAGSEGSLETNLDVAVRGGKNQRQQALFNLTRQAAENQQAHARRLAGEDVDLPWPMPANFPDQIHAAVDELDPDEHETRFVLAVLLSTLEDERGIELLRGFLTLDPSEDPDLVLRIGAVQNLGLLADPGATEIVIGFLDHPDRVLRLSAAGALSKLPGEGVRSALLGALGDNEFDVRATAALSASKLVPPLAEAAPLLRDLTGPEIYAAERERDRKRFTRAREVSSFRVFAVTALGRLGLEQDRAMMERLRDDEDLLVAEAAIKVLSGASPGSGADGGSGN
jgi:HEAT repeat protein